MYSITIVFRCRNPSSDFGDKTDWAEHHQKVMSHNWIAIRPSVFSFLLFRQVLCTSIRYIKVRSRRENISWTSCESWRLVATNINNEAAKLFNLIVMNKHLLPYCFLSSSLTHPTPFFIAGRPKAMRSSKGLKAEVAKKHENMRPTSAEGWGLWKHQNLVYIPLDDFYMYCMRFLFQIRSWKLQKKREKVEATGGKLTVHMTIQSTQNFSWKNVSKEIIADAKVHRRRLEMKNTQIVPGAQIQSRSLKRERKIHTTPSTSAGAQEHLPPAQRILPFSVPPTSYFGHFKFRGPQIKYATSSYWKS